MIPSLQSILIALAIGGVAGGGLAGWGVWQFRAAQVLVAKADADDLRGRIAHLDTIIVRQQRADAALRGSLAGLQSSVDALATDGARRAAEGATGLAAVRRGLDSTGATIAALTARIQAPTMLTCADALAEWRSELSR